MNDLYKELIKDDYLFPSSIEEVSNMKGSEFEEFIYHYYIKRGLEIDLVGSSNDHGIDLILKMPKTETHDSIRIGIQCKRWSTPIPKNEIVKMLEGKSIYNLNKLMIITTSNLTQEANKCCRSNNIIIKDKNYIQIIINNLKEIKDITFKKEIINKNLTKKQKNKKIYDFNEKDQNLLNQLKIYRQQKSKSTKLPIYMIFGNETINQIVYKKPKTKNDLLKIKGLGEIKVDLYGEEILKILNE